MLAEKILEFEEETSKLIKNKELKPDALDKCTFLKRLLG